MNAAMSCARCQFHACRGTFALYPGAASDPAIVPPPPHPSTQPIRVRSAGAFEYRFGVVEALGIAEGGVRRKLDIVELVVAILVPVPLALLGWVNVIAIRAGFLALALPFTLLAAFMIRRAVVRRPGWRRLRFHSELLRRARLRDAPIP